MCVLSDVSCVVPYDYKPNERGNKRERRVRGRRGRMSATFGRLLSGSLHGSLIMIACLMRGRERGR